MKVAIDAHRLTLAILLLLMALNWLGIGIPVLVLGVVALVACLCTFVGP